MRRWRWIIGTATLVVMFSALALWYSRQPEPLPNPIASFPFDVSHKGGSVDAAIQIPQRRSWVIAVWFMVSSRSDFDRILELFDGDRSSSIIPISVPIHLVIQRVGSGDSLSATVYDSNIENIKPYAHGISDYDREVVTINLNPGLYHITAVALANNPGLAGVPASLTVEYRAYLQFMANAVNPIGDK